MTKLAQLIAALRAYDAPKALSIAAKFPRLGDQRERIQRAHAAATNPRFYKELGRDPNALVRDGIAALHERYGR